jgi:hypothetical protein
MRRAAVAPATSTSRSSPTSPLAIDSVATRTERASGSMSSPRSGATVRWIEAASSSADGSRSVTSSMPFAFVLVSGSNPSGCANETPSPRYTA